MSNEGWTFFKVRYEHLLKSEKGWTYFSVPTIEPEYLAMKYAVGFIIVTHNGSIAKSSLPGLYPINGIDFKETTQKAKTIISADEYSEALASTLKLNFPFFKVGASMQMPSVPAVAGYTQACIVCTTIFQSAQPAETCSGKCRAKKLRDKKKLAAVEQQLTVDEMLEKIQQIQLVKIVWQGKKSYLSYHWEEVKGKYNCSGLLTVNNSWGGSMDSGLQPSKQQALTEIITSVSRRIGKNDGPKAAIAFLKAISEQADIDCKEFVANRINNFG